MMDDNYAYMEKMVQLYGHLQDRLSKELFWARLQFEAEPDMDRAFQLCQIGYGAVVPQISWRERISAAIADGKKLVLYGAGSHGAHIAGLLLRSHMDFYAFCDQNTPLGGGVRFWESQYFPRRILSAILTGMSSASHQRHIVKRSFSI